MPILPITLRDFVKEIFSSIFGTEVSLLREETFQNVGRKTK